MEYNQKIDYECVFCHTKSTRQIEWISPLKFSGKPIMNITFWCTSCSLSNTMSVKFIESTKSIKLVKIEDTALVSNTFKDEKDGVTIFPKNPKKLFLEDEENNGILKQEED